MSTKKFCDFCEQEIKPNHGEDEAKTRTIEIYDIHGAQVLSREFCADCEQWLRRLVSCTFLQLKHMWAARDKA